MSPSLSSYDPQAPRRFDAEAKLIAAQLRQARAIEHVGSTAVPGLAGKPTIDVAVGVQTLALDAADFRRLETLGYAYGGDHGLPQHVFRKGAQVPWEFLVHVVEYDGEMWRNFLRFRNHLRSHPEDARAYAALKESLLARRDGWYSGRDKERFIASILSASD